MTPEKIPASELAKIASSLDQDATNSCPSGFSSSGAMCTPASGSWCTAFKLDEYSRVELELLGELCSQGASSFLQGAKDSLIKDGLFVTQPLRSDSQAAINIVERSSHGG